MRHCLFELSPVAVSYQAENQKVCCSIARLLFLLWHRNLSVPNKTVDKNKTLLLLILVAFPRLLEA